MINKNYIPGMTKRMLCFILGILFCIPGALYSDNENTMLTWAFLIRDQVEQIEYSVNENDISLYPYQLFKFIFQTSTTAFIFLFHYSKENELTLLFPHENEIENRPVKDKWYDVPSGRLTWFQHSYDLEEADKFFLIASRERLKKLESLIEKLRKTPGESRVQKEVLDEIGLIIKGNLSPMAIETPVPISGVIKSGPVNVFEVKDVSFFAKIITVRPVELKNDQEE